MGLKFSIKRFAVPKNKWFYPVWQILWVQLLSILLPLEIIELLKLNHISISGYVYSLVIIVMAITTTFIWIETLLALKPIPKLIKPRLTPLATAIIAAYLPNEASTIIDTLNSFFQIKYPRPIQIILAYNTPYSLPIETKLRELTKTHPNLTLLRVRNSKSKAENINEALCLVKGDFVGIFDADHRPDPLSFSKAMKWIANGYSVVQGRCVISNYNYNLLTKIIAIEFELMYAVNHPGRNTLHQFGIFGGSNGFWKTKVLEEIRMRSHMLTEDIDSSIRAVIKGHKIASDPTIISYEMAPTTLFALWNQRLRWAQGWFQVTLNHQRPSLKSPYLSLHQKLGSFHLLSWRELYPWISSLIIPLLIFWLVFTNDTKKWFVPLYFLTIVYAISSSLAQTVVTHHLSSPTIKPNKKWFIAYFFISLLAYAKLKDIIAMIAHLQEFMGQRTWEVTPRQNISQVGKLSFQTS